MILGGYCRPGPFSLYRNIYLHDFSRSVRLVLITSGKITTRNVIIKTTRGYSQVNNNALDDNNIPETIITPCDDNNVQDNNDNSILTSCKVATSRSKMTRAWDVFNQLKM